MRYAIHATHPISNPPGAPTLYTSRTLDYNGDPCDVRAVGAAVSLLVGFAFDYRPGYSRVESGRVYLFPRGYRTGVHCMWIQPV